jgi:cyclopropane fatty-acyl-phospholipid synthase-like methyltransferase
VSESLHNQIVGSYYHTTVADSHSASRQHYEVAADGLLRWLKPWLPANRSAQCLDLATGCGEVVYLLEREGYTNTAGVDLCVEELDKAREFVKGTLRQADVLDHLRQTATSSVDFITALNILEHLNKDDLFAVLTEVRRVLKPQGTLVALVPNAMSPFGSATRYWDMTHQWAFTPGNFRQLARVTGFDERIDFRECSPVPYGLLSGIRWITWQVLRGLIAAWLLIEVGTTRDRIYTMNMLVRLHRPGLSHGESVTIRE